MSIKQGLISLGTAVSLIFSAVPALASSSVDSSNNNLKYYQRVSVIDNGKLNSYVNTNLTTDEAAKLGYNTEEVTNKVVTTDDMVTIMDNYNDYFSKINEDFNNLFNDFMNFDFFNNFYGFMF